MKRVDWEEEGKGEDGFDTEERMLNETCADARTKGEYATSFSCIFRKVEIEEPAQKRGFIHSTNF